MFQYKSSPWKFLTESDLKPNKTEIFGPLLENKPGWLQMTADCEEKVYGMTSCHERVIHTEIGELTEWRDLEVSLFLTSNPNITSLQIYMMPPRRKSSFLETDAKTTTLEFFSNLINTTGPWFGCSGMTVLALLGLHWGGVKVRDSIRRRYSVPPVPADPENLQPSTDSSKLPSQEPTTRVVVVDIQDEGTSPVIGTLTVANPIIGVTNSLVAESTEAVESVEQAEASAIIASEAQPGPSSQARKVVGAEVIKINDKRPFQGKTRGKSAPLARSKTPLPIRGSNKQPQEMSALKEEMIKMREDIDSLKQSFNSLKQSIQSDR